MQNLGYRQAIEDYVRREALPVDKYSHQPRLYLLCRQVAGSETYDDDVLHAAAWLHDLGVFIGHRPENPQALATWNHLAYATRVVPRLLHEFGFPADKVGAVLAAIADHLPAGQPTTFEGIILRDADLLEQLGAVGILRNVCKIGRDTRYRTFSDVLALLQRNLAVLPGLLRLPSAKALAKDRAELLRSVLVAAEAESGGTEL